MTQEFEWDDVKAASNASKHGVTFIEAATAFSDPLADVLYDEEHSSEEDREILRQGLLVSFTVRGDVIRVISARVATRSERKRHEEKG